MILDDGNAAAKKFDQLVHHGVPEVSTVRKSPPTGVRSPEVWPEAFSRVIDVSIKGIHLILLAFLPAMIAGGSGIIVNFSSGWGRSNSPEVAAYCCTKWGVEGLTQALFQELPSRPRRRRAEFWHHRYRDAANDPRRFLSGFPGPRHLGEKAVPFLETLGPRDNGKALTAPQG